MNNSSFNTIMFIMVPILAICIFIFCFAMMFSPKARSKMMGNQIQTLKHMMEDNKELLADLNKSAINVQKNILAENEDVLKDIATKKANINKEAIEITSEAIKKGLNK